MEKFVFDANVENEENMYSYNLDKFRKCTDLDELFNEYKDCSMRFLYLIRRDIAKRNNDLDFVDFLDSVINNMTDEIKLINEDFDKNISKFNFHERVNIINYVKDNFYDKEYDTYEILNENSYNLLKNLIIEEANLILEKYDLTLKDTININLGALSDLLNDRRLYLDICYASELIKINLSNLKIREIKNNEYPILEDFLYEAIFIPEGVEKPSRDILNNKELQVYISDFGKSDDNCLVAVLDNKIIGACWSRIMNDYGHIDDSTPSLAISLYPEYRGNRIGTILISEMLKLLKNKGYSKVSLAVQKANYAVKMYKRVGFKIVDDNEEEFIMICDLK